MPVAKVIQFPESEKAFPTLVRGGLPSEHPLAFAFNYSFVPNSAALPNVVTQGHYNR